MTIHYRPRRQRRRQAAAVLAAASVLYLISVTAASSSAASALDAICRRGELAVDLLRCQLGDLREEEHWLADPLRPVFLQFPVLAAGEDAVLLLRRGAEEDVPSASDPDGTASPLPEKNEPVPETPSSPHSALLFADNGVPARTLIPSSPEGYVVAGDVYITNTSSKALEPTLFSEAFSAALKEADGPKVLILHTHGSEAYTMPEGQEYVPSGDCRTTDCQYNVVSVGAQLKATLEARGIDVIHDRTLHDYPQYSGAYDRSLRAAEAYLEQYPSISIVLDIHRDAVTDSQGAPYKVISTVAGANAAQLAFVVGSDGGGLYHPDWPENLKLAAAVQQRLTEKYPTLMRPITLRDSRYNQHLTPGSLLVEVGAAGNSLDEALLSIRLFGEELAQLLLEKAGK